MGAFRGAAFYRGAFFTQPDPVPDPGVKPQRAYARFYFPGHIEHVRLTAEAEPLVIGGWACHGRVIIRSAAYGTSAQAMRACTAAGRAVVRGRCTARSAPCRASVASGKVRGSLTGLAVATAAARWRVPAVHGRRHGYAAQEQAALMLLLADD